MFHRLHRAMLGVLLGLVAMAASVTSLQAAVVTTPDQSSDGVPDITSISFTYNDGTGYLESITVTYNDSSPIAAPSDGAANSIGGYVAINLDGTADIAPLLPVLATGLAPAPVGIDYYFVLDSQATNVSLGFGSVIDLFENDGDYVESLQITFTSTSFTISGFPLELTFNSARIGAITGPLGDVATDQVPDGDSAAVPEPATMFAWSIFAVGAGLCRRRRR